MTYLEWFRSYAIEHFRSRLYWAHFDAPEHPDVTRIERMQRALSAVERI